MTKEITIPRGKNVGKTILEHIDTTVLKVTKIVDVKRDAAARRIVATVALSYLIHK